VFIASRQIDVGEELLFDYNDRDSKLPFLRTCPVCDEERQTNGTKRRHCDEAEPAPAPKKPAMEMQPSTHKAARKYPEISQSPAQPPSTVSLSTSSSSIADEQQQPSTSKAMPSSVPVDLQTIARKSKPTKAERERLYKAAGKRFPAKAMTRSALESWLPGIHQRSVDYVMQRRNADACNTFKMKM